MSDEERNKITAQEGVESEGDAGEDDAMEELPGEATFVGDPPELDPQHEAPLADDSSSEDLYYEGAPMGEESIEDEAQHEEPESSGIGRGKWIDSMLQRIDGNREGNDSAEQALPRLSTIEPAPLEVPPPIPAAPAETADQTLIEDFPEYAEIEADSLIEVGAPPPVPGALTVEGAQELEDPQENPDISTDDEPSADQGDPLEPEATEGVALKDLEPPLEDLDHFNEDQRTPTGPGPSEEELSFGADDHTPDEASAAVALPLQLALDRAIADPTSRLDDLRKELMAEDDEQRQALTEHEIGHLLQSQSGDESEAVKAYANSLNLDPTLRPNIWAIRRIFIARKMWPNLLKLYDAEIHFEEVNERRAEVLLEKGWILEDHLEDHEEAKACYWEAHRNYQGWLAPLVALERLAILQEDLSTLAEIYPLISAHAEDPQRKVAALMDRARLEEHISDGTPQRALQFLREALDLGHGRAAVLTQMEQVACLGNISKDLPQILRWQAEELQETAQQDPRRAAAKLRAAARIAKEQLQDQDLAQQLLSNAKDLCPDEILIQQDLIALAEERGDWTEVEQLLGDQAERTDAPEDLAALYYRIGLARIEARALNASEAMDQAMELVPGFLPALIEQERRFLARNSMEELVELWLREAAAISEGASGALTEDEQLWRATILWRTAMVVHHQQKQPERALELCREALAERADFRPALDAAEALLWETGDHEGLALHLQGQLAEAPPETAVYLRESLAALYEGALDQPEKLLVLLEEQRRAHPDDRRNTRRLIHSLERLREYDRLIVLLSELESTEEEEQHRIGWQLYQAQLLEGPMASQSHAIAAYQALLQRVPDHSLALQALEDLLRREGRHEELAGLLRQAADQVPSDDAGQQRRYDLLQQLGTLFTQHLNRPADAVIVYSELLALRPDDLASCKSLLRAAQVAGDTAKMAETLEALSELLAEPAARARIYFKLAEIYEHRLADEDRTEELLAKALETAPSKGEVLDALEGVVRHQIRRGDFAEAVANLKTLSGESTLDAANIYLEEAAWLTTSALGDVESASDLWYRLQQEDPQNRAALWAKIRLSARTRDVLAIAEASRRLAEITEVPELEAVLNLRAGMLADTVGDPESSSTDTYRRILQSSPDNLEALLGLFAKGDITAEEEADLSTRLALIAPDKAREDMRLPLALANQRAGKLNAAVAELTPILTRDPEHLPSLIILHRIAVASGDQHLEAKLWVHLGRRFSDRRAKAAAFNRGALLLEKLERPADAAVLLRHVLTLLPEDHQAFDRLQVIYRETEDHKGIEELLGYQILQNKDQGEAIGLYFERSEIRLKQLSDKVGAVQDLLHVLESNKRHSEALRQLSNLYDEDHNYTQAYKWYHRYTEATDSIDLKRPAVLRMAEILHDHLGRTAEAVDVCRRFLDRSPDDEAMLEKLAIFFVKLRDFPHAISILERLGGLRFDHDWKADKLRQIGGIYWKDMRTLGEARKSYMQARDLDPTNIGIVSELRLLCQEMDQGHDIERLLERAKDDIREAIAGEPLSIELYRKLMQVAEWNADEYTLVGSLGVLCFLGVAEKEDQELYSKRIARGTFDPKQQVGAQAWREALVDSRALSAYASIWAIVADYVPKLYEGKVPATPFAFGVSKGDRVNRNAKGPISVTLDRIAGTFGLGDFDIYLNSKEGDLVQGIAAEKSSIVIGAAVVSAKDTVQRFRIGRTLSLLRDKAFALELLSTEELELFFSAVIFSVEPGADFTLPRAQVEAESRRINKALSRKAKRSLRLAVNRFMQEGGAMESWVSGVLATANRAGLLACGDILVALEQLVDPPPNVQTAQLIELFENNPQAVDLLIYSVGEGYLGLRKELQL